MAQFEREVRYVVIKLKHLLASQKIALYDFLDEQGIDQVTSVVVEDTNPIYEDVWEMMKNHVEQEKTNGS